MIEEEEFQSILSVARRVLDVYGRSDPSDSPRIDYTHGDIKISGKRKIIEIFFRGSLVFRHAPDGEITDFFELHGDWINELERMGGDVPPDATGIASQRQ
jgi:hypothetical protein